MLVNIFDQGDLDDPATLEALTPSHDAESGQRQAYGQMVDDVSGISVHPNSHVAKRGAQAVQGWLAQTRGFTRFRCGQNAQTQETQARKGGRWCALVAYDMGTSSGNLSRGGRNQPVPTMSSPTGWIERCSCSRRPVRLQPMIRPRQIQRNLPRFRNQATPPRRRWSH